MFLKFIRKRIRFIKSRLQTRRIFLVTTFLVILVTALMYANYMQHKRLSVDTSTYTPLLQLIAQAESKGNYNAYFGNAGNTSINFTEMTIKQVMSWQADYIRQGSPSDAVGRYQFISTTLADLVEQLNIDSNKKFDSSMQDTLAMTLLERRGAESYVNNELTRHEFAANLSKEWAALPKAVGKNPESSYYAADGLNKSLVSIDEVLNAIKPISPK